MTLRRYGADSRRGRFPDARTNGTPAQSMKAVEEAPHAVFIGEPQRRQNRGQRKVRRDRHLHAEQGKQENLRDDGNEESAD